MDMLQKMLKKIKEFLGLYAEATEVVEDLKEKLEDELDEALEELKPVVRTAEETLELAKKNLKVVEEFLSNDK